MTAAFPAGAKRKREAEQAQLIPFRSAASELVAMLLNSPIPTQRPAECTSEAAAEPETTSSRTPRLRSELPSAADKSSSQLTFVPMASSGGVEAMPAISPFTSAAEHAFDQRPQVCPAPALQGLCTLGMAGRCEASKPCGGGAGGGYAVQMLRPRPWLSCHDVVASQQLWRMCRSFSLSLSHQLHHRRRSRWIYLQPTCSSAPLLAAACGVWAVIDAPMSGALMS